MQTTRHTKTTASKSEHALGLPAFQPLFQPRRLLNTIMMPPRKTTLTSLGLELLATAANAWDFIVYGDSEWETAAGWF